MRHLFKIFLSVFTVCQSVQATETTLTLNGSYEFRTDSTSLEIVGLQVCFYPSAETSIYIPRPAGDSRMAWFCFSNSDIAAKQLGFSLDSSTINECGISGMAEVVVSNYKSYDGEGDSNDVAALLTILRQSKSEPIPCVN